MLYNAEKTFKNYVERADLRKGKVLPVELNKNTNSLRMRLDTKQIAVLFSENKITVKYLDRLEDFATDTLIETTNTEELSKVFEEVKKETIPKYHYSLDVLLISILED